MFQLRQWINWRTEQRAGDPKPAKVPYDPDTGTRINPHDSSKWTSYEDARARDSNVGFVLTDNDPYFCIDLDHAWDGAYWSALALDTLKRFPHAYVEVSFSGDGLHLIGRGVMPDGYGTRGPGAELYSGARFIAITGIHARGNPDHPCDLALWAALYLKPSTAGDTGDGWTVGPCEGSTPITDDAELIRKMTASRPSAGVAFGDKASAADLWAGNIDALALAWPHEINPYDRSSADAALASHLAFWTGRDCPRIERLMRQSALVRDKWNDHGSYLTRTIAGAASRCARVYDAGAPALTPPDGSAVAGWQYLTADMQVEHFAGCCYVKLQHKVLMPNGTTLKPEVFNATMGGYEFQVSDTGRPEKKAFTAFTESRVARFPKADQTCFRPGLPQGALIEEDGLTLVNSYVPASVQIGKGGVSPFLDLLQKMLPDMQDRAIMLAYLAALRQYPGVKFRWCPLIQGVEGNGKGIITAIAEYAVGVRYTHRPKAKELGESGAKFNLWMDRKLLIIIDEIRIAGRSDILDSLKSIISDNRMEIQGKGDNQEMGNNCANFIMTSNYKDAIIKTRNDRRYAIFYTAQQTIDDLIRDGMDGNYAPRLWRWLEAGGYADVAGFLERYEIPDALNPAGDCHRAPHTSATDEAIQESRGYVEQCILEAIAEGRPGFAGGWVSSIALSRLLDHIRRNVPPRKRGAMMESLGYIQHPALPTGRTGMIIMQEDGKRPRLYVLADSINHLNLTDPSMITHAYMKAQGYADLTSKL